MVQKVIMLNNAMKTLKKIFIVFVLLDFVQSLAYNVSIINLVNHPKGWDAKGTKDYTDVIKCQPVASFDDFLAS